MPLLRARAANRVHESRDPSAPTSAYVSRAPERGWGRYTYSRGILSGGPHGSRVRVSVIALVSCLVCIGAIADRVPEPIRPSRTMIARELVHRAKEAEQDAAAACLAYALSPEATDRWLLTACAELLRGGAVLDDIRPAPAIAPDRPGITL